MNALTRIHTRSRETRGVAGTQPVSQGLVGTHWFIAVSPRS
ncbi:hypothetical protein [Gordonia zhenghanii]|nr:hypothetical protein [Gordonia zhenghanii]